MQSNYHLTALARTTPGLDAQDHSPGIDMRRLRTYRYGRVQQQLRERNIPAILLTNPINIRYATGSRNMQLWALHTPARYAFIPANGKAVLFDFDGCQFLSEHIEVIGEIRPARSWVYFSSGSRLDERAVLWGDQVAELLRSLVGDDLRLAVDRLDFLGAKALERHGIELLQGQEPMEHARKIKNADEIACIGLSITACETGMARMREALRPGITENQLWSILHQENIAAGGEWIESRLLVSGGRTNPWFQESSDRIIRAGELVAFDANLVGPFGYLADVSRTFFCGPGKPSGQQRDLYSMAAEEIAHNVSLIRPGLSFREFTEKAWTVPDSVRKRRTMSMLHGAGMVDEWPRIPQAYEFADSGYDGYFEENMTVCVESYVGTPDSIEGVKLEQQVLVTKNGIELLSTFPYEDELLST